VTTRRPGYSVLSNDKLARVFGVRLPHWEEALRQCLVQRGLAE
jgi:dTDP-4-dehydrorhamnose reductase